MDNSRQQRGDWYRASLTNIHFDYHPSERDTQFGSRLTEEHLVRELAKARPAMVQFPAKGGPGYATYPTKVGVSIPGLPQDCLRVWRDATRRLGIKLVVYYNALDWAQETLHPDWVRIVDARGQKADERNPDGTRKIPWVDFCNTSDYQDVIVLPMLREIIEWYDPDGFWFDAENYCITPCYCPRCAALFRERHGKQPPDFGEPDWGLWAEFHRALFIEALRKNADFIHRLKPDCCYVSNYSYSISQPEDAPGFVDWLSGDIVQWGAPGLTARVCAAKHVPFDVMTSIFAGAQPWENKQLPPQRYDRTDDELLQDCYSVLANGGRWIVWDNPTLQGSIQPAHLEQLGRVFRAAGERKEWLADTEPVPWMAALYGAENHYRGFADPVLLYHPLMNDFRAIRGLHKTCLEGHRDFSILTDTTLKQLNLFSVLFLLHQQSLPAGGRELVESFVRNGGSVVAVGGLPEELWPVFGIGALRPYTGVPAFCSIARPACRVAYPLWALEAVREAETRYPFLSDVNELIAEPVGLPGVVLNRCGRGRTAYFTFDIFSEYQEYDYPAYRDAVLGVLDELDARKLADTDAPAGVELTLRRRGDRLLVHLVNLTTGRPNLYGTEVFRGTVRPVRDIRLDLFLPVAPRRVLLQPGGRELPFTYDAGRASVVIDSLRLHAAVEVQGVPSPAVGKD